MDKRQLGRSGMAISLASATSLAQLDDILQAAQLSLPPDAMRRLDAA